MLCLLSIDFIMHWWSSKFNHDHNTPNQSQRELKCFHGINNEVQTSPLGDAKANLSIHSTSHARFYGAVLCLISFRASLVKNLQNIYHRKKNMCRFCWGKNNKCEFKTTKYILTQEVTKYTTKKTACQFFWCQSIKCEFKIPQLYFMQLQTDSNRMHG